MPATGTRTVYPLPNTPALPGAIIVDELWLSTDYRMPLMHLHSDPHSGEIAAQVIEFNFFEPDPALFAIPYEYKIR